MSEALRFRDVTEVRSVVITFYKVEERVKRGWFANETYLEEVKTWAEKVIFENGEILKREELNFRKEGIYRNLYEYNKGLEIRCQTINPSGKVIEDKRMEYFPNNKLKRKVIYKNGKEEDDTLYKYDSHDNLIEYTSYYKAYVGSGMRYYTSKYTWHYGASKYGRVETKISDDNTKEEFHYDHMERLKKGSVK